MTKVYRILASSITYYVVNIEADSEEKAYELAGELDSDEFMELDEIDWQIDNVCLADKSMLENYRTIKKGE
jgi:hypothetical protein